MNIINVVTRHLKCMYNVDDQYCVLHCSYHYIEYIGWNMNKYTCVTFSTYYKCAPPINPTRV